MEEKKISCSCSEVTSKTVFACSGASDLGEISDLLARKFKKNKVREMKCLAMVACDSKPLIENLKTANILIIDGCAVDCAKKIIEKAGLKVDNHVRITDYGYKKGQTPASEETVNQLYNDIEFVM